MEELTPIDFIAQIINSQDSFSEGRSAPTRYLCLREDLRTMYKKRAERAYNDWVKDELEAKEKRGD